jgi:hypothetical protein
MSTETLGWICVLVAALANAFLAYKQIRELRRWGRLNAMLLALCIKAYGLQNADLRAAWRIYMRRRAEEAE